MTKPYFREIPDFQYVNRTKEKNSSIDYITVKNFFKRIVLTENQFSNITFYDKYVVEGDDRPDNVAYKVYKDSTLDWVVLLSNNIIDVYSEWPLTQTHFENYLLDKYESVENLYKVHHYETYEIKDSQGTIIIPEGLILESQVIEWEKTIVDNNGNVVENPNYLKLVPYKLRFFDNGFSSEITYKDVLKPITNYEYELNLEEEKRQIYLIKPKYLNSIFNDIRDLMEYKKGSEQYVSRTLVKASDFTN